ncbi:MAG: YesL family protein [bacterium]|nr:YesL family protein [bacterium]
MFDKLMNSYYFGKSGKGDYTPEDLPKTRWALFVEMLRVRLSGLCRLNLMYALVWLPTLLVILWATFSCLELMSFADDALAGTTTVVEIAEGESSEVTYISMADAQSGINTLVLWTLLLLIPCIAITGPATAGVCYVTRNWARDEHAFVWSDFKDAVKENWKQSLVISLITSLVPIVVYMSWRFYGSLALTQPLMTVPQVLVLMIGVVWCLAVTYMHPLIVSYRLRLRDVLRNGLLLAIARLPMSVGIRLLHCVPVVLMAAVTLLTGSYAVLVLAPLVWYVLIGFALSRFITASYTNAVFDRFINSRIEGAQVGRGLAVSDDDDDDDEDDEDDTDV